MELVADDSIRRWRSLIGPTNCQIARVEAPQSLRALYGSEGVRNACHGSDSGKNSSPNLSGLCLERAELLLRWSIQPQSDCLLQ